MNVNENRLEKLIEIVAGSFCERCPLRNPSEEEGGCAPKYEKYKILIKGKYGTTSYCFDTILNWLQDFDVAEALEAGAHIVNDRVIFPPKEIPYKPNYGLCDRLGKSGKTDYYCEVCDYAECCPYLQPHSCPFDDKTCFNYGTTEPCLNCPYAE